MNRAAREKLIVFYVTTRDGLECELPRLRPIICPKNVFLVRKTSLLVGDDEKRRVNPKCGGKDRIDSRSGGSSEPSRVIP